MTGFCYHLVTSPASWESCRQVAPLRVKAFQSNGSRPHRGIGVTARAQQRQDDLLSTIKKVAKKVQGSLPIVGLISRLATPEGGFDDLAYPEFCRGIFNKASSEFRVAIAELEKTYGKFANSRYSLLVLWMASLGVGLVSSKDIIMATRRLRVTQDLEAEMDRFSQAREAVVKKYQYMDVSQGSLEQKIDVAVDGISTLVLGLKDGQPIAQRDVEHVISLVKEAFPESSRELIAASVMGRPARATAYA